MISPELPQTLSAPYRPSPPPPHIPPTSFIARLRARPRRLRSHPPRHIKVLQRIRRARPTTQYALLLLFLEFLLHLRIHYSTQERSVIGVNVGGKVENEWRGAR